MRLNDSNRQIPRLVRSRVIGALAALAMAGAMLADAHAEAPDNSQVRVFATLRAKPGSEAETRESLLALVAPSRGEPGCITYEIDQPADDPALFLYYEVWRSRADLEAHFKQPYFAELAGRLGELLAQPADIRIAAPVSP